MDSMATECVQYLESSWVNWPDLTRVHSEETIEEDKNANQGCWDQHAGVPAQPCKVKADFLTKVTPGRETQWSKPNNKLFWL